MIQFFVELSICTIIFYGLFMILYEGKNNHQFNRFYLLGSLLFSICIPLLEIPVFPEYVIVENVPEGIVNTDFLIEKEGFELTWENGFFTLWITGVVFNVFLILKSIFSLFEIIKNSEKEAGKEHIKVFTNDSMTVSSFLHYLFIPKSEKQKITDYEIKHELTHIRQKHSLDILFVEIVKAIFWFNPIMYAYKKHLVEIHEFLADQNTSSELGKEAYEAFLIRQITATNQTRLVHNFYSLFKKRLIMMQSNISTKKWQYWVILPIFLVCFTLFSCENYKVQDTQYTQTYPLIPNKINDSITNYEHDITDYPAIPPELLGENIDTVFTFDPEAKTVSVHYEKYNEQEHTDSEKSHILDRDGFTGTDTIITFDPVNYTETVVIVNYDTGVIDTIQ